MRLLLVWLCLAPLLARAQVLLVDRVAAAVDLHAITRSSVEARARPLVVGSKTEAQKEGARRAALMELIEEQLIRKEAQRLQTRARSVGELEVVFQVKEGDVFRMGKVSLTGFPVGAQKDVLKGLEAKPKSVFSRSVLQRDMERIRSRARQRGFSVEITPLTTVDAGQKIIDVVFELEKKPSTSIQF